MTNLENALVWLYVKSWGKFGDHVLKEKDVWSFGAQDLETAIMGLAYPRKKVQTERVKALTDLITEKFNEDRSAFREWSAVIHQEFTQTLPETADISDQMTVKILKWDPGKYLKLTYLGVQGLDHSIFSKYIMTDNSFKIRCIMHL